jgi:hypothetical protein
MMPELYIVAWVTAAVGLGGLGAFADHVLGRRWPTAGYLVCLLWFGGNFNLYWVEWLRLTHCEPGDCNAGNSLKLFSDIIIFLVGLGYLIGAYIVAKRGFYVMLSSWRTKQ